MTTQPHYPYADGDIVVLGPQVFASADGETISWQGANYRRDRGPETGGGGRNESTASPVLSAGQNLAFVVNPQTGRGEATGGNMPRRAPFGEVQGRCPACRGVSLFLGSGGHVTCSRLDCSNPTAADELLHGEHITADTPLVCSDERHAAKVADLERQLAALREVVRGYCPACGRGDAAPTVADWEQQRTRAEQAEAALRRVHAVADRIESGAPWAADLDSLARRIRDAATKEQP